MYEVEVKAVLKDRNAVMKKLQELGCEFSRELHQIDDVFDPDPKLFPLPTGVVMVLRIREEGGRYIFTFKMDKSNSMDCIEHEVEISDKGEMEKIIKLLGFKYQVQVDKKRIKAQYRDIEVVLDNVKDLGEFIEAEKMTNEPDGDTRKKIQEELFAFLETLGIGREDRVIDARYDTMLFKKFNKKTFMIKVIIFDGVNCITYQEPLSVGLARDYKLPLEKTLPFFKGVLQDCVAGKSDLKEVLPPFLEAWGWQSGVEGLLKYWFERDHKIDNELVSYIKELRNKGVICLLGTNNEKYRFTYMLDKMGFNEIFDKSYCSAILGCKKPDQQFFSKIYNELENIKKEEVLFLDDKAENVESAKDFGINAELYTTFEDFIENIKKYNL